MRRPARGLLVLLCALLALALVPWLGHGELPSRVTNPDASRTVTWTMNDTASLTTQNVAFGGGNASLPWSESILPWPNGTTIASNGALDSHLVASPSGISLRQNWSNRVANGNFTSGSSWTYIDGTADNTTASWESSEEAARLNHTSHSTGFMWDPLDGYSTNWAQLASPGSNSALFPASGGQQMQGSGAMGDFVNVSAGSGSFAGAQRSMPQNWGAYDQLNILVYMYPSAPAAFNMSAQAGLSTYYTAPVSLAPGWQNVSVDLTQLGSDRSALGAITLRIVGIASQQVSNVKVIFDAIRLGASKVGDSTASVFQRFMKSQLTTPLRGSAYLDFDWCLSNATGVEAYTAYANLSGPSGFVNASLAASSLGVWSHSSADVSPEVASTGVYNLSFSLRVILDNISASNVTLLIDNASFVFPGTVNGTYISDLQTMGVDSLYTSLAWFADLPSAETSVTLALRTGNTTSPGGPTWSGWQSWSLSPASPTVPGAVYFELRADLTTTNASVTPVLESLTLDTQHHVDHGSILSGVFRADSTILSWRSFSASFRSAAGTTLTFEVGNGSYLLSVVPGSSLSSLEGPFIQWRAVLSTTDGLLTPVLHTVSVTYEYLGPPTRLVITHAGLAVAPGAILNVTSGEYFQFGAVAYDAGSHAVPASLYVVGWTIDNATGGSVLNNGTYVAGKAGIWEITAVLVGTTTYASVRVNVTGGSGASSMPPLSLWDAWPLLVIGIAALGGFAIYEVLVRRLFAIDDVFLIAKDGRLIFHNTRRMRADRDEDILSSMLTAIMAFLRDQDPEENGELKSFEVGGKTTLLERGEHAYLTAIYSGRVPGWAGKDLHRFMADLERGFGDAFANWTGSPEDLHGLKEYMQRFVSRVRYHGPPHLADENT